MSDRLRRVTVTLDQDTLAQLKAHWPGLASSECIRLAIDRALFSGLMAKPSQLAALVPAPSQCLCDRAGVSPMDTNHPAVFYCPIHGR